MSGKSVWATVFWPKTRNSINASIFNYLEEERVKKEEEQRKLEYQKRKTELENKFNELNELSKKEAKQKVSLIWSPVFWEISKWVRELQKLLWFLWYFTDKDTAIFWNKTKQSIVKFQLDKEIIKSEEDRWAWIFWPKTSQIIEKELSKKILEEKIDTEEWIDEKMLLEIWVYSA